LVVLFLAIESRYSFFALQRLACPALLKGAALPSSANPSDLCTLILWQPFLLFSFCFQLSTVNILASPPQRHHRMHRTEQN
jgi:hypothetical protein